MMCNGLSAGSSGGVEYATFGMGCFWCSEAVFARIDGVLSVKPGYSGGTKENPTYREVCSGSTGHAEVIHIAFDPQRVSYVQLLEVFFRLHDPTTVDQQGVDVGTQYRSVIFTHSAEQETMAREAIQRVDQAKIWHDPVVTIVEPFKKFWEAEDYHHNYFEQNSNQGYCRMVIKPKLEKLNKIFSDMLKK